MRILYSAFLETFRFYQTLYLIHLSSAQHLLENVNVE